MGSTLTGIVRGAPGAVTIFVNTGPNPVTMAHLNVASTQENRLLSTTGANLVLGQDDVAVAIYDGTAEKWRVSKMP